MFVKDKERGLVLVFMLFFVIKRTKYYLVYILLHIGFILKESKRTFIFTGPSL